MLQSYDPAAIHNVPQLICVLQLQHIPYPSHDILLACNFIWTGFKLLVQNVEKTALISSRDISLCIYIVVSAFHCFTQHGCEFQPTNVSLSEGNPVPRYAVGSNNV
jgi:hypothetical protein